MSIAPVVEMPLFEISSSCNVLLLHKMLTIRLTMSLFPDMFSDSAIVGQLEKNVTISLISIYYIILLYIFSY